MPREQAIGCALSFHSHEPLAARSVRYRKASVTLTYAGLCLYSIWRFLHLPNTQNQKQGFCHSSPLGGLPAERSWQMVGRLHVSLLLVQDVLTAATMSCTTCSVLNAQA